MIKESRCKISMIERFRIKFHPKWNKTTAKRQKIGQGSQRRTDKDKPCALTKNLIRHRQDSNPSPSSKTILLTKHALTLCFIKYLRHTFNPFPKKPLLLRVCNTSLLKTLWKKGGIAHH